MLEKAENDQQRYHRHCSEAEAVGHCCRRLSSGRSILCPYQPISRPFNGDCVTYAHNTYREERRLSLNDWKRGNYVTCFFYSAQSTQRDSILNTEMSRRNRDQQPVNIMSSSGIIPRDSANDNVPRRELISSSVRSVQPFFCFAKIIKSSAVFTSAREVFASYCELGLYSHCGD